MHSNTSNEDSRNNSGVTGAGGPVERSASTSDASVLKNGSSYQNNVRFSALSEKHAKPGDDSDPTILSYSPPLEVLAASTVEHRETNIYDTFSRTGMLTPGTQLAHFVVTKYIGGGGMGRVYLGVDQALDRKVALKVLPMQRAHDQGSVARFMNEAKSAARLNHEHIAQVYFAGEQNGIPFIAFEYVQGTNIRAYIADHGVLPLPQATNYLLQISHALAHAATHQVIHRDVKPSNILITPGGRAKLIDMGLARLLTHANVDNDLTASGVTLGTFDYISPEQARDPRNADTRSDIYSLGCTFFFMLTGRPPFSEGTVLQKLLQHQGDVPPDVRDFQPGIPLQVSQIIQKMMAKDPRSRYQTASELVEDLTDVAKMIGLRPVDSGSLVWQLPQRRRIQPILRHLPWLVPLLMFGLLVVLVRNGVFFSADPGIAPPVVVDNPSHRPLGDPATGNESVNGNGATKGPAVSTPSVQMTATLLPNMQLTDRNGASLSQMPRELLVFETNDAGEGTNPEAKDSRVIPSAIRVQPVSVAFEIDSTSSGLPVVPKTSAAWHINPATMQKNGGNVVTNPEQAPAKLVVDPTGQITNSYKTLKDAARAAAREATIELHFNGQIDIEHFRFTESQITIRSGEGYRAKLRFQPTTNVTFTGTYSMAALTNSDMVFENVDFEMTIPQNVDAIANRWTMFDLVGNNSVELHNVALTINNAQQDRVYQEKNAFFRCLPTSAATYLVSPGVASATPSSAAIRTHLTLRDSLIRGEASLLRCDNSRAAQIDSDNVLIATSQPVFSLFDIKPSGTTVGLNMISATFNHNTIYAPTLVSWQPGNGGTLGHSIKLSFNDSIVRFNRENGVMAEYAGGIAMLNDVGGFYSRDSQRTFYQNFAREWGIRPIQAGDTPRDAPPVEQPDQQQRYFNTVIWDNPFIGYIPVHSLTKNHFLLDEASSRNNALKSNLNGTANAGINPKRIPDI